MKRPHLMASMKMPHEIHDHTFTGADLGIGRRKKSDFAERKQRFLYEILPFIIADYKRETDPETLLDDNARKLRHRTKKLAKFEKLYSRLDTKFNK